MNNLHTIRASQPPAIPATLVKAWRQIRRDHRTSGSGLVGRALAALEVWASDADHREFVRNIEPILVEMATLQPQMASLVNLANFLLWTAEGDRRPQALLRAAAHWREKRWREMDALTREAANLIAEWPRVVTVSRSGAVESALLNAHQQGVAVEAVVMESRPLREGIKLAERLASAGIRVRLKVDAGVAEALDEPSIVLIGADAVVKDGVVNKIGSRLLTAEARLVGRPCFALTTSDKLWPADLPYPSEQPKSYAEIARQLPAGVTVENKYFETVPLDRFRSVLVGGKRFNPADLAGDAVHAALSGKAIEPVLSGG